MVGLKLILSSKQAHDPEDLAESYPSPIEIQKSMEEVLENNEVSWRVRTRSIPQNWLVDVPSDLPILTLQLVLQEALEGIGASIESARSDPVRKRVVLNVGWPDSALFTLSLSHLMGTRRTLGKIAIVIDDFGDRWEPFVESFMELGVDITLSVLPGRKMSKRVSEEAADRNFEVILHLPMEPLDADFQDDGYTILAGMSEAEIKRVVHRGMQEVPHASGVNNHMGSRVTADRRVMADFLREIFHRDLLFIDSRTTAETVAYDLAQRIGIPCAERDVFLDVERNEQAIRRGFRQLAQEASIRGYSVGIGHCHQMMLNMLRSEVPKYQEEGYRFVRVSEVVR